MKKLYKKNTVHPTPPLISQQLAFLPATILTITSALSPEDQEALSYLLSCPAGNFSSACGGGHPTSFNCYCFNCYMSYWVRWDSSPNRQLIHQVIDAYEDGLEKQRRNRGERRKKSNRDSAAESKNCEVMLNGDVSVEESSGGGGEDGGAEKAAARRLLSFIGEKIWSVWTSEN